MLLRREPPVVSQVRDAVDSASVLAVAGHLDVYTSPFLKRDLRALFARGRTRIVVNLEKVEYIDSTGLGVLMDLLRRVRALGGSLSVVIRAGRTKRLLESLGVMKVLPVFDEDSDALAASTSASEQVQELTTIWNRRMEAAV
jgi:anti-sigma B factor antagonist